MKKILFLSFLGASLALSAQTNTDYLKEINRDIWLPFAEAYRTFDAEMYKSIHSKDFIRGEGNSKSLQNYEQYFGKSAESFKKSKEAGNQSQIQFRFLERFANAEFASERGIYYYYSKNKEGKERKGYGKFHVFMRKIGGSWKIIVDYDSNENNTIDEKTYSDAFAIDDFEKY